MNIILGTRTKLFLSVKILFYAQNRFIVFYVYKIVLVFTRTKRF